MLKQLVYFIAKTENTVLGFIWGKCIVQLTRNNYVHIDAYRQYTITEKMLVKKSTVVDITTKTVTSIDDFLELQLAFFGGFGHFVFCFPNTLLGKVPLGSG